MTQHKAASIPTVGKPAEVVSRDTPSPGEGQVLVKNRALAINPVDWKIRDEGLFAKSWPMIVGSDIAGEVAEIGAGVTNVKKGDRVLGATTYLLAGDPDQAGFQEYTVLMANAVTKIPDSMSYADASVVPLSAATAAAGLFQKDYLGLDYPSTTPKPNGKKLLIWGGSSSVSSSAIQLAVAAGYEVVTTCSPRNFDYVKKLGASKVFDYNSPSVVGDVTEELSSDFAKAFDGIGTRDSELQIATILAQLGGGQIASVLGPPEEMPANVNSSMVFAITIFVKEPSVGDAVFQTFLPAALASGQFAPMPTAEVTGNGVGALEEAMNAQRKGVSAKKIVVTL